MKSLILYFFFNLLGCVAPLFNNFEDLPKLADRRALSFCGVFAIIDLFL